MARERLRVLVAEHMDDMTLAQIKAAKGTNYLVTRMKQGGKFEVVTKEMIDAGLLKREDVTIEVWEKQPSTQAYTDLMNRALDKPKEQPQEIQVTGTLNIENRLAAGRQRLAKDRNG